MSPDDDTVTTAVVSAAKDAFFIGFFEVTFFTGVGFFGRDFFGGFDCVVAFATGVGMDAGAAASTLLTTWWPWRLLAPLPESGMGTSSSCTGGGSS
jgi:hypothetical protein